MIATLNLTFRRMDATPALEALVRAEMERLEHAFAGIVSAHVTIERDHARGGAPYDVRIELDIPGRNVVVSRHTDAGDAGESGKDPALAVRHAFRRALRALNEHYQERWQ